MSFCTQSFAPKISLWSIFCLIYLLDLKRGRRRAIFVVVIFQKTIDELLNENYVYARALHYLGVDFFLNANKKLDEICFERKLNKKSLIKAFYEFDSKPRVGFQQLERYPLELLTQYLKHSHQTFIKEKVPFILYLIKNTSSDLSISHLLPEFIEDFIIHIYEEEDTIFKYIDALLMINSGKAASPSKLLYQHKNTSLREEYKSHKDEDEFAAIRALIKTFEPQNLSDRLLIQEVKSFDRELIYHSEIENEIFFPRAIKFEGEVIEQIKKLSSYN